jgi:carbon storage regulator
MLVLSRKVGQKIVLDDRVTISINRISGNRVSVGITAPPGVRVVRSELGPETSEGGFSDPLVHNAAVVGAPPHAPLIEAQHDSAALPIHPMHPIHPR